MSTTVDTQANKRATEAPVLLAVSYLRVATREQAERGGTDEGFSIPAQRVQVAERLVEDSCASITISKADYQHLAAEVDAAFDKRSAGRDQEFADLTANRTRLEAESEHRLTQHDEKHPERARSFTTACGS